LGGAGSPTILAKARCSGGHVGGLELNFWNGVEGCVLSALSNGEEGLSGWVGGFGFDQRFGVSLRLGEDVG
jgi:hypothetical protein